VRPDIIPQGHIGHDFFLAKEVFAMKRLVPAWLSATLAVLISCGAALAAETSDQALFSAAAPDAMIVLDLSGSMRWNPRGETDSSQEPLRRFGNDTCSGESFYSAPQPGFTTDCARYLIAKRAIYKILDDNRDGVIDVKDEAGLTVRLGFWKFSSGNRRHRDIGQPYAAIWCGAGSCAGVDSVYGGEDTILYWTDKTGEKQRVSGSTSLAACMEAVKPYLDDHRKTDPYKNCRTKFVILLTDGQDTLYCGGTGSGNQSDQYKRRRASVARVKALRDAGYKVFVIGLGDRMPDFLKNTLNWMAYHGGTENPNATKKGSPSSLNIGAITADPCAWSATTGSCSGSSDQCFAANNDPGTLELAGYAFISTNSKELETALRAAMTVIRDAAYSFSTPSVATSRTEDENYLYAASFKPVNTDPFWKGSLKKYAILSDQTVGGVLADAGTALQGTAAGNRKILTVKGGSLISFTTANLTATDLGVGDTKRRDEVVGYIRGEAADNPDKDARDNVWKLGDIFHSNPVTVGTPSLYFVDPRDRGKAFDTYRIANRRTSESGRRIIVAGANDGQLHAFRTSDLVEAWSFIPPNILDRLKDIAHKEHPATLPHRFYVDGPITVADVWTGAGDGKVKSPGEWKTLLVVGLGQGGDRSLWSSSASCDSGFSSSYLSSGEVPYYCGYHALEITDTLNPRIGWQIKPTASQAPYLGDPWSRMVIRRVRIGADEKWVGFIGGGHRASSCSGAADCDARGKGFFVVDLATGSILWSFNRNSPGGGAMNHALPATAAVIDSDMDGFADRAYVGDLGGNIWRFSFCKASDGDGCTTAHWKGSLFFQRDANTGPVYTAPAVARDVVGDIWVYWGTGDRLEPLARKEYKDGFFAVRDLGKPVPLTSGNLQNISGATQQFTELSAKDGWYILLGGKGEKVLANPTVFGGVAYFTTYTPESEGGDPCEQAGTARLYGISCLDGAGSFTGGERSTYLGKGISSAPLVSAGSEAGKGAMFGGVSGGSNTDGTPWKGPSTLKWPENRTHLLHWRDARMR
jgi:hypothetical protein